MFETNAFKRRLADALYEEATDKGLAGYEPEAVTFLQDLAIANESILMERELRKAAGTRRGITDALASARELAQEASRYARSEKRNTLSESDMEKAYGAKFCKVWPFCKG